MHTEEQAREKWCPFAKFNTGIAPERIHDGGFRCIASDCMAWRWVPLKVTPEYLDAVRTVAEETGEKPPFAKAARTVADGPGKLGLPSKPFRGFCGLAGKE